jgi:hypothetical protein
MKKKAAQRKTVFAERTMDHARANFMKKNTHDAQRQKHQVVERFSIFSWPRPLVRKWSNEVLEREKKREKKRERMCVCGAIGLVWKK